MKREALTDVIRRYESSIQVVVDCKLRGLNPTFLTEQGRINEAQTLSLALSQIDANKLGPVVEKRIADAKKLSLNVDNKPKQQPTFQPGTYQMSLEEAHPGGVAHFYRWEKTTNLTNPQHLDPEKGIGFMHNIFQSKNSRSRDKFRSWEERRLWAQLKRWLDLPTEGEKEDILRLRMNTVIEVMKDVMPELWKKIQGGKPYNTEEAEEFSRRASSDPRYVALQKRQKQY